MADVVIQIEEVGKLYRLGQIGTGSLAHDINRWWHKIQGKEDPYRKIGASRKNPRSTDNEYVWALHDISFTLQSGEVVGIIGKNGAGKSTLLKILSRVTAPTRGSISIKGRIAALLEVGTGFHPELTGRENIYLNGAILGMSRTEITRKLDEIIAFSDCETYIDTPVKRYSSGMHVRLAFSVAAHLDPEILIVDEVLAVGDAEFQKRCLGKMNSVAEEGRTVIFVSHNLGMVSQLCRRGIVLQSGMIAFDGDAQSAIMEYQQTLPEENTHGFSRRMPQNDACHIQSLFIKNTLGLVTDHFAHSEKVHIWISIIVAHWTSGLTLSLHVRDKYERSIFMTERELSHGDTSRGGTEAWIEIPELLLMPGVYSIRATLHIPNVVVYDDIGHAARFTVHDTGSRFARYGKAEVGVIAVSCRWSIQSMIVLQ